ncbi:MAG: ATP-binding protein, partial [Roseiflexaceae bacterium]|nr:ATP-binding protein [Roseiflexaceae bacterium]
MSIQLREMVNNAAPPSAQASGPHAPNVPVEPTSIAETGIGMGFINDLILKIVYFYGNITGQQLGEVTKLPFLGVIDRALEFLKLEEYVDIIGAQGG